MAVAQRPLNPQAVKTANEQLWRDNPELGGRQLTMTPEDYAYRRQWMEAYTKALRDLKPKPPTSGGKTGDPACACPAATLADLVVNVIRINDGQPLAGVLVQISGPDKRNGVSNSAGLVEFRGVQPGPYTIRGTKANHGDAVATANVMVGRTTKADLRLVADVDLDVSVVDDASGAPIRDAAVRLTGPATQEARTNAAGHAGFIGIPTGTYRIDASAVGFKAANASVTVRVGSNIASISLTASAGLTGRVLDSNDRSPLHDVTVTLDAQAGPQLVPPAPSVDSKTAITDANGNFDFGELQPGQYQVAADRNGNTARKTVQVSSHASTTVELLLDTITVTSVKLTPSPKKIIYRHNESITFKATVQPAPPPHLLYHWYVDGVEDTTVTGDTLTRQFQPAATVADRRKDDRVEVRVTSKTARLKVRVAQNVNVGTANVAQSNAGMDTLGWTDFSPETFDTSLSAAEDASVQLQNSLTRQVLKKTLADGTEQYGRLQFVGAAGGGDMVTTAYDYRSAALVYTRSSAFAWKREEFEGMLLHERQHCQHRTATTDPITIWKKLLDAGFNSTYSPFSEMFGYFSYVQSKTVSYKFLLDYGGIVSFVREYNNAKTALSSLSGATKTKAQALIQECYDNAQFSELREAVAEGWDQHIDPP